MGLFERSKRILEIKSEKRKKQQRGEGRVDTKSEDLREGSIGTIDGLDFTVLGMLVYDWGGGRWEEFYLEFPDTEEHKWLSKEGTTLELLDEVESADAPDPAELKEGAVFDFQGEKVKVNEVGRARVVAVEGGFPWDIATGTQVTYADCEFERTGETLSLEKPAGARVEVYRGNEISRRSLEIF